METKQLPNRVWKNEGHIKTPFASEQVQAVTLAHGDKVVFDGASVGEDRRPVAPLQYRSYKSEGTVTKIPGSPKWLRFTPTDTRNPEVTLPVLKMQFCCTKIQSAREMGQQDAKTTVELAAEAEGIVYSRYDELKSAVLELISLGPWTSEFVPAVRQNKAWSKVADLLGVELLESPVPKPDLEPPKPVALNVQTGPVFEPEKVLSLIVLDHDKKTLTAGQMRKKYGDAYSGPSPGDFAFDASAM